MPYTGTDGGPDIRDAGPIERAYCFTYDCSARCRLPSRRLGTMEQMFRAMRHWHPYAHEEEDGMANGRRRPLPISH